MWHPKIAALIGAILLSSALPHAAAAQLLISEAEANLPAVQDTPMATRGITRGPGVELISPSQGSPAKSPVPLVIKFSGRNHVAIDPASVKLTYVKAPPVDLTARVKAYVTKDGLEMKAAEVPPGRHVLRLEVKDVEGRSTTSTITLTVAK